MEEIHREQTEEEEKTHSLHSVLHPILFLISKRLFYIISQSNYLIYEIHWQHHGEREEALTNLESHRDKGVLGRQEMPVSSCIQNTVFLLYVWWYIGEFGNTGAHETKFAF